MILRLRYLSGSLVFVLAAVAPSLGGCPSDQVIPPSCPDDVPASCPSPAPGFAADAAPILNGHCVKCHAPGGMAQTRPFQTYDQIAPFAGDILLQLELCGMPPAPEPPLTAAERQAMFGWILCGALND